MTSDLPSITRLQEVHDFPGRYLFKVFGTNSPAFVEAVRQALVEELEEASPDFALSTRESARGKHVCVTLDTLVQTPEQVHELYLAFRNVDGVRMVL